MSLLITLIHRWLLWWNFLSLKCRNYSSDSNQHPLRGQSVITRLILHMANQYTESEVFSFTHTHLFNGPLSRTTWVSLYQKGKTNLDFTETRDSEWVVPSVLWHCWLGSRKGIRPVKIWVVGCWHGYLPGARCRLAYGPADATATHCLLLH